MRTITVLTSCLGLFLGACGNQNIPPETSDKPRSEQWMEDISFFEHEFVDKAKTYTDSTRVATKNLLVDLKKNVDDLSDFQIRLELSKAVVFADNAHTSAPLPLMEKIPLRFYRFSDGIHVVKTDTIFSRYLGAKLIKVNSIPVNQLERLLFPYTPGIESNKKITTINWIAAPKILYELGLGDKDSITLSLVKGPDTLDVTVGTKKMEKDRSWFKAWANLYPSPDKETPWNFLKNDIDSMPLYLRNAEEGVFYSFHDEEKMAYFQITSFWDDCPDIKERIQEFLKTLKTKSNYDVVMDLRFYTGGDYGFFTKLATTPPKLIGPNQKIFLVLSEKTYSAGIVTAARIKHYAKDKLVIVGEEVGDRLKFWAEGEVITLPHSKIRIYNAQKEHDWKDNKRGLSRTHLANFFHGVPAKNLNLDQEIKLDFQSYMNNIDPVWEWIVSQSKH